MSNKSNEVLNLISNEKEEEPSLAEVMEKGDIEKLRKKRKDFLKNPNYKGLRIMGRHVVFVKPDMETKSGIVLQDGSDAAKMNAEETFDENVYVTHFSEECTKDFQVGDLLMLNFHAQFVDFFWKEVPHIMVHEDYILATCRPSEVE